MEYEITPEPTEEERAAIRAALAQDAPETPSAWAEAVLPRRDGDEEP